MQASRQLARRFNCRILPSLLGTPQRCLTRSGVFSGIGTMKFEFEYTDLTQVLWQKVISSEVVYVKWNYSADCECASGSVWFKKLKFQNHTNQLLLWNFDICSTYMKSNEVWNVAHTSRNWTYVSDLFFSFVLPFMIVRPRSTSICNFTCNSTLLHDRHVKLKIKTIIEQI